MSSFLERALLRVRRHLDAAVLGSGGSYRCPVCGYRGAFRNIRPETGLRKHAQCPSCGSAERHRLQWAALAPVLEARGSAPRLLHVAPEAPLQRLLRPRCEYVSADLVAKGVDCRVDLTALPFGAESFDIVFASHVLEHVTDDRRAIAEVRRILRPGGLAVLPVPVLGTETIEYGAPNPHEAHHVRCPGSDYFDRYREAFSRVDVVRSDDVSPEMQPFVYEDRSRWPETMPLRPRVRGERHLDYVPFCYV